MKDFEIRRMNRHELDEAIECAAREGWNPGLHDAECFWAIDPEGFFVGILNERPIVWGSALRYDDNFAFCGLYITANSYRGQGYGIALTRARLDYVGQRNAGLDGVLTMVDRYARLGYQPAHRTTRYSFIPERVVAPAIPVVPASLVPLATLQHYDSRHFPADRPQFLEKWLKQPNSLALAIFDGQSIEGYGVLRPCRDGYKIGPLFAESSAAAEALFLGLCNFAVGSAVSIDVPEPNLAGIALANKFKMTSVFACIRMYLRTDPQLPLSNIFGITTFEAG